ncbi:MAG: hypothetical protein CVV63_03825 [Tenericutes bacterium HGW-Tenericutes-8]|nr:MAG: hypothetical protein CVV63_03825 [Tenericutes bacterium HGW-Tenericutes-8]
MKLIFNPSDDIQSRLDQIPLDEKLDIILNPGIYQQRLTLRHPNMHITGIDAVITAHEHALSFHPDGLLNNTFRTQTVLVLGDHITLENLTILNESGKGQKVGQAIALSTYGDDTLIQSCTLVSTQDTLFFGPLPSDLSSRYSNILSEAERHQKPLKHYVFDSTIIGDVDFVFGSSDAFIDQCTIISNGSGYIAAPSTHPKSSFGLVFNQCTFKQTGAFNVVLARPWRSGGKALFKDSTFLEPMSLTRFNDWDKPIFHFYEQPYVSCIHSKPLPETMATSIMTIIASKR